MWPNLQETKEIRNAKLLVRFKKGVLERFSRFRQLFKNDVTQSKKILSLDVKNVHTSFHYDINLFFPIYV